MGIWKTVGGTGWTRTRRLGAVAFLTAVAVAATLGITSEHASAKRTPKDCTHTSTGLTPLIDMGTTVTYKGSEGGLYPGGQNTPPADYLAAGVAKANTVKPLDANGNPSATGTIGFISIGFSVTRDEFLALQNSSKTDATKNLQVKIVNAAQSSVTADQTADPNSSYWPTVDSLLVAKKLTKPQVEVVWVKTVDDEGQGFPYDPMFLKGQLEQTINNVTARFPNVKIVYVSARSYSGYTTEQLRGPEPEAYEVGFAVKWTVQDAVNGAFAPGPWVGWGPYFWADGLHARSDGLTWACADFKADGIHPVGTGLTKTTNLWNQLLHNDPTATPWYLKH